MDDKTSGACLTAPGSHASHHAPTDHGPTGFDPSRDTPLRREVVAVINEMSRFLPNATEDWRARLTEALL